MNEIERIIEALTILKGYISESVVCPISHGINNDTLIVNGVVLKNIDLKTANKLLSLGFYPGDIDDDLDLSQFLCTNNPKFTEEQWAKIQETFWERFWTFT